MSAPRPRPRRGITVRLAGPADAPRMARLMGAAVRAVADRYPVRAAAAWGALPALYHRWAMTAGGETRLVAEAGGRLLGFAGWRGREVTALFVHPRAAGRGLGRRLLSRAEAGAARSGARALVVVAGHGAVGFYLARGWRPLRPATSALPDGLGLPAVRMVKPTSPRRGG